MSSTEYRKENIFLEVAWYLPCVPRGTQGKKPPQSPGGGRSGRSVEDHPEKPTLGETLEGPAGGVPVVHSANAGRTPVRPAFSHLCGSIAFDLFTDVSVLRSCLGALLLHLVLAGTKMTTEREETEEATCRERLSEQQVALAALCQGRQQAWKSTER